MTQFPAITLAASGFTVLDWTVLVGYFLILAGIGAAFSRAKGGAGDYFLGGRRMPVWAVSLSVLATATSAATFIGGPEEAYVGDLTYLSANIGTALAVVLVALLFIPAFYRHNVTTVYDLLADRFGPAARTAASGTFMIGRVFASGSRVFVAALPASLILFDQREPWQMLVAIGAITAAGILTAYFGGIRSVIWTDVVQVVIFVGAAAAAIAVLLYRIPVGPGEIVDALRETPVAGGSKLTILRLGIDPAQPRWGFDPAEVYTLLTAVFGFSLLNLAAFGTDHDLTQRMLTCRNAVRGGSSAFLALALNLPLVALFMSIGLLLHVFYRRPDLMGAGAPGPPPEASADVFLRFILDHMPAGLTGLMMAGLFAVGVGSLNSAIGAMSATLVNDFYRPLRPGRDDRHYLRVGRAAVLGWGIVLGLFAGVCVYWYSSSGAGTLIRFVLGVMTFAYAGLLGVFLTALCTRRGNSASAIAALLVGFMAVTLMQPGVWTWWTGLFSWTRATPGDPGDWRLGEVRLSFPWRLTIAVALAFVVCFLGPPRPRREAPRV